MKKEPSAREQQVLSCIAQGKTSKEIAAELGISLRTVNTHRENIAKKIGSSSLAAMIRYAIETDMKNSAKRDAMRDAGSSATACASSDATA